MPKSLILNLLCLIYNMKHPIYLEYFYLSFSSLNQNLQKILNSPKMMTAFLHHQKVYILEQKNLKAKRQQQNTTIKYTLKYLISHTALKTEKALKLNSCA